MTYRTFYDLMDLYEDDGLDLPDAHITTPQRISRLTMARLRPQPVEAPPRRRRSVKRTALSVLAAAALVLALSVTAYAVYQARLKDYLLPLTEEADAPRSYVSMAGYQSTPEYAAFLAWTSYLASAEPVDYEAMGVDDSWFETGENYAHYYSAVTRERADALDAIMEQYGLVPHAYRAMYYDGIDQLYQALGTAPLIKGDLHLGGYLYDDGSCKIEGAQSDGDMSFSMFVSVKGSFSMITIAAPAVYEEWTYTTSSGQTVDLVLDSAAPRGFVLFETEGASVNATTYSSGTLTRADLEAFADSIDLAALAARFDGVPRPETAQAVRERWAEQLPSGTPASDP